MRNRSDTYAPCQCGGWPQPSDQRAGHCRVCLNYRPADWFTRKQRLERRARGWRAVLLGLLFPVRWLASQRTADNTAHKEGTTP